MIDPGKQAAEARIEALRRELIRLHGADWRVQPPDGATPVQILDAGAEMAGRIREAEARLDIRQRNDLVAWHRAELERLGAAA